MTKLQEILVKVSDARARNVSEENINEYLRRKGYSRDSFEDAVRYLINKQGKKAGYQKALGDSSVFSLLVPLPERLQVG